MQHMKVLISGASIAGPALALCLNRYGFDVTVVERSEELRPGGQAVDFKGEVHRKVLERMGILDDIRERQTGKTDLVIVDDKGKQQSVIPGEFIGGDVEILRGDLADILYGKTSDTCRYIFGDSITTLTETPAGVDVTFEHTDPRSYDLVFGADGIHSAVRRLAFGPEDQFVEFLGYYYAIVGGSPIGAERERSTGIMYNEPGVLATSGGPKAPQMYVFAADERDIDRRDEEAQRQELERRFAGVGWEVPRLLTEMREFDEFYMGILGRVAMDRYTSGRVALIGDSAYGNTLGGFGTGLAIVGAYVLAGELAKASGDYRTAFARYDEIMHRYAKVARKVSAGPFLAPPTKMRIRLRNWTFKFAPLFMAMMKVTDRFATDIDLPEYEFPQ